MESTISICREYSVSSRGPFHRTSTPKSRPASRTPACTDMKNRCDVALGTTPMSFLVRFWQDPVSRKASNNTIASLDLDCMTKAQYTLRAQSDHECSLVQESACHITGAHDTNRIEVIRHTPCSCFTTNSTGIAR